MNANLVKCPCNNCSGHIEFESEHVGETVLCPHCQMETLLFIPQPLREQRIKAQLMAAVPARLEMSRPVSLEPMGNDFVTYAKVKRGVKTNLGGLAAELLGLLLLFVFPIGTIIGILFIIAGAGASRFWRCSNCGNPVADKKVRICASCNAHLR